MNKIIAYFDLRNNYLPTRASLVAAPANGNAPWWPQYLALMAGVIIQPYLQIYLNTKHWDFSGFGGWIIASVIISIIGLPAVYKNAFDTSKPLIVQLCVIFISGMGWQSIVSAASVTIHK